MSTEHKSSTPENIRDLWQTPRSIFDKLNAEFGFLVDLAAADYNALCPTYFSEAMDSLSMVWPPVPCWCNPPYSDILPWVKKAHLAAIHGTTTIMLIPSDTSGSWFAHLWATAAEIRFISGRLSFINVETQKPVAGNNKGSMIVVFKPDYLGDSPVVSLIKRSALL